jgi:hypothetical protein
VPIISGGGGGVAFNGGTITNELVIDTAATNTQALELQGTRTGNVKTFGIDYPNTTLDITSDGVVDLRSADTLAVNFQGDGNTGAGFSVQNQPTGQIFQVNVKNGARAVIIANNQNDGNALLQLIGSAEFHVQGDGTPRLFAHAAPADGDLTAGELALWFDQTDGVGNTKLMAKAKSADGTVKTASIVLA